MSDPTEQALVEAMARGRAMRRANSTAVLATPVELDRAICRNAFNDLRAALPEGVVLTSDGLGRVQRKAYWCAVHETTERWTRCIYSECPPADPLVTLTRIEERTCVRSREGDTQSIIDAIGDAPVRFWSCPNEHPREPLRVTVVWSLNGVAFCADCGMTNLTDPRRHSGSQEAPDE